jgi:asparagine synthase (glutamine-hydrolysing)
VMSYDIPGDLSESQSSRATAEALGYSQSLVTHREDFLEGLAAVIRALEEPLGDSVVVPTYELFRASRSRMKVVLSGEGADEVFGGYAHHQILKKIFRLKKLGLGPVLSGVGRGLSCIPPKALSALTGYPVSFDGELSKRARALLWASEPGDAYDLSRELFSPTELSHLLKADFFDEKGAFSRKAEWKQGEDWAGALMSDLRTWLPNYGLLRIDKLSMAHGLECRVPYLHHEFAEAALALTLREGSGMRAPAKKVLRDLVQRKCGNHPFAKRKKQPFFLPLKQNASLDRLCREYLSEECLKKTEVFEPRAIEGLLRGRGSFVGDKKLFCVLSIQMWLQEFGKNFSRVAPIFVTAAAIALSR